MIISKSSWHYKYIASTPVDTYYVHNLCKYMRCFFYATLWRAVVLPLMVALGYILFLGLYGLFVGYGDEQVFVGGLIWLATIFFAANIGIVEFRKRRGYWFIKPKTRVKRPPNPFIQAIKDKHNKLCRMVEYSA